MKIFGLVLIREKEYTRTLDGYTKKIEDLEVKVGALEFERKQLRDIVEVLKRYLEE